MPDHTDTSSLDLERADFSSQAGRAGGGAAPICASCSTPLANSYYTRGDAMLCERCSLEAREAGPPGSMISRASGALGLGVAAAVVAGLVWLGVTELTGYELGLIAIVVGLLVGGAVRMGGRGVGGVGYQLLAVALTYSSIVLTYVPSIVDELRQNEGIMADFRAGAGEPAATGLGEAGDAGSPGEAGDAGSLDEAPLDEGAITAILYAIAVPIAFVVPFMMGFENIIGILIIGFALWEAWKMNRRVVMEIQGPYQLGTGGASLG